MLHREGASSRERDPVHRDDRGGRARPRPERALLGRQRRLHADEAADVEPFFLAVAAKAALYEASAFVTLVARPRRARAVVPGARDHRRTSGQPAGTAAAAARRDRQALRGLATSAPPVRFARGDERALGPRDGRKVLRARLPAPARTRCDRLLVATRSPVTHRPYGGRSRGSRNACSRSATGACGSRRPRGDRRASREVCSGTGSRTGCPCSQPPPPRHGSGRRCAASGSHVI